VNRKTNNQDYIANCISRIIDAEAAASKRRLRETDLADAVRIAAAQGEKAAHNHLIWLSKEAEAGRYKETNAQ